MIYDQDAFTLLCFVLAFAVMVSAIIFLIGLAPGRLYYNHRANALQWIEEEKTRPDAYFRFHARMSADERANRLLQKTGELIALDRCLTGWQFYTLGWYRQYLGNVPGLEWSQDRAGRLRRIQQHQPKPYNGSNYRT